MANQSTKETNQDFARLQMILDIYGSEVRSDYDMVIKARNQLNKIAASFRREYETDPGSGESFLGPYVAAQKQFEIVEEQFLERIAGVVIAS